MDFKPKVSIEPKKVQEILSKHGTEVSLEEAETILLFLTELADISIKQVTFLKETSGACQP